MNPISLAQSFLMDIAAGTVGGDEMRARALLLAHSLEPYRSGGPEAEAMRALWTICWQTGDGVEMQIVGTHETHERVTVRPHQFEGEWEDIRPRLIAWADLLSHREANKPLPEPPA